MHLPALIFLLLAACAQGKVQKGEAAVSAQSRWVYLSRFTFDVGVSHLKGSFKVRKTSSRLHQRTEEEAKYLASHDIQVHFFLDEEWERSHHFSCEERVPLSRNKWDIDEYEVLEIDNKVTQSIRPHVWYLVLSNCHKSAHELVDDGEPYRVDWEVEYRQENGSHFGVDEYGLLSAHLVTSAALALIFSVCLWKLLELRASKGGIHPATWFWATAYALHMQSVWLEFLHLLKYSGDGVGMYLLDVGSEVTQGASQVLGYVLLLCVGWGWTLTSSKAQLARMPLDSWAMGVIIAALMAFQLGMVYIGRAYEEDHYKYHDHETWSAFALVGLRLLIFGLFYAGVQDTHGSEPHHQKRLWIRKFGIAGAAWFLVLPVCVGVAMMVPTYYRHRVVSLVTIVGYSTANLLLARQLLGEGEYHQLSMLSKSLLPGGGKNW